MINDSYGEPVSGYEDLDQVLVDSLRRYVIEGIHPGGFLQAVLNNSLSEAAMRADSHNFERLGRVAGLIYNEVPLMACGSPEKVNNWIHQKGYLTYKAWIEKKKGEGTVEEVNAIQNPESALDN